MITGIIRVFSEIGNTHCYSARTAKSMPSMPCAIISSPSEPGKKTPAIGLNRKIKLSDCRTQNPEHFM